MLLHDLYFGICTGTMLLGRVLCSWHVCVNVSYPISIFCPIYYSVKTGGSDTLLPTHDSRTMWAALWCHLSEEIPIPVQTWMFNYFYMLVWDLFASANIYKICLCRYKKYLRLSVCTWWSIFLLLFFSLLSFNLCLFTFRFELLVLCKQSQQTSTKVLGLTSLQLTKQSFCL